VEIVLFTGVGILLYLASDRLLSFIEKIHGEALPQRNVIFFVLILSLSLGTFSIIRGLLATDLPASEESAQHDNQEQ